MTDHVFTRRGRDLGPTSRVHAGSHTKSVVRNRRIAKAWHNYFQQRMYVELRGVYYTDLKNFSPNERDKIFRKFSSEQHEFFLSLRGYSKTYAVCETVRRCQFDGTVGTRPKSSSLGEDIGLTVRIFKALEKLHCAAFFEAWYRKDYAAMAHAVLQKPPRINSYENFWREACIVKNFGRDSAKRLRAFVMRYAGIDPQNYETAEAGQLSEQQ